MHSYDFSLVRTYNNNSGSSYVSSRSITTAKTTTTNLHVGM